MGLLVDTFATGEGERKRAEMCPSHWHAATRVTMGYIAREKNSPAL